MGKQAFWAMVLMLGGQPLWGAEFGGAAIPSVCGPKGEGCQAIGNAVGSPTGADSISAAGERAIPAQIRLSAEAFKKAAPSEKAAPVGKCKDHIPEAGGCFTSKIDVPAPKQKDVPPSPATRRDVGDNLNKFAQGMKNLQKSAAGFVGKMLGLMTRG